MNPDWSAGSAVLLRPGGLYERREQGDQAQGNPRHPSLGAPCLAATHREGQLIGQEILERRLRRQMEGLSEREIGAHEAPIVPLVTGLPRCAPRLDETRRSST